MTDKKNTLLAPCHLWREEEPKPIEFIVAYRGKEKDKLLERLPFLKNRWYNHHEYQKALTAYKAKYPERPEFDWVRFEDRQPVDGTVVLLKQKSGVYNYHYMNIGCEWVSKNFTSKFSHWCDKDEHDLKVSKWESEKKLYEGFEKDTSGDKFEIYVLKGVAQVVFMTGDYVAIRMTNKELSGKGITLSQFEAITGLKARVS